MQISSGNLLVKIRSDASVSQFCERVTARGTGVSSYPARIQQSTCLLSYHGLDNHYRSLGSRSATNKHDESKKIINKRKKRTRKATATNRTKQRAYPLASVPHRLHHTWRISKYVACYSYSACALVPVPSSTVSVNLQGSSVPNLTANPTVMLCSPTSLSWAVFVRRREIRSRRLNKEVHYVCSSGRSTSITVLMPGLLSNFCRTTPRAHNPSPRARINMRAYQNKSIM